MFTKFFCNIETVDKNCCECLKLGTNTKNGFCLVLIYVTVLHLLKGLFPASPLFALWSTQRGLLSLEVVIQR